MSYVKIGHTDKGLWISINNERVNIPIETAHQIADTLKYQAQQATRRLHADIEIVQRPPLKKANWQHRVYNHPPAEGGRFASKGRGR
jgi:hypothetical protein